MACIAIVVASRIQGRRARRIRYRNYEHEYLAREFAADLDGEVLEVLEAVLQEIVDFAAVHGQVIVDQYVSQPGHRHQSLRKFHLQEPVLTEQPDRIPIFFDRAQPVIGNDVVADVENDLDGQLQVSLDISDYKWILDEFPAWPAAQGPQQPHIFAQFCQSLGDDHGISQRKSPS